MDNISSLAIQSAINAESFYTKFITANDAGSTGAHQAGFHISKSAWPLFFSESGVKGSNKDAFVTIKWQNDFETDSRFIYYGTGTRNEYRLTRFGRGFPFLSDDNVGDLLILCKSDNQYYHAYVLQRDEEIEDFFASLNISSTETNKLIFKDNAKTSEEKLLECFYIYLKSLEVPFPPTFDLARQARSCFNNANNITSAWISANPDNALLKWIHTEYELFKTIENDRYKPIIQKPFSTVEELVEIANQILNRRKSRAGKSLEHHLEEIFKTCNVSFSSQGITEGTKKPDFIFPSMDAYHDKSFNSANLTFLASKTTCKDRWRQILNEADRIDNKFLFTLQQGISINQLIEMENYKVSLVVPKSYVSSFPKEFQIKIFTLDKFMQRLKNHQRN